MLLTCSPWTPTVRGRLMAPRAGGPAGTRVVVCLRPCPPGLSDPFVIVELGPPHLFPLVRSQRTQVKSRTLHPVYDELFYL